MSNMREYAISDFKVDENIAFLVCASFESRCTAIASHLSKDKVVKAYVFAPDNEIEQRKQHQEHLMQLFTDKALLVELEFNNPFSYSVKFYKVVSELIENKINHIMIDISTFTHEMLLILLKILSGKKDNFNQIELVYLSAAGYSIGDKDEHKWLSKGCKEVRSVLGFPGIILPNKPICLILLVGFEHERALALINDMDPDVLYMGYGMTASQHIMSEAHVAPMTFFERLHSGLLSSREGVFDFAFSVKDIEDTVEKIKEKIIETPHCNHIVVPLNTKTSTIAAGIVALQDQSIQLCYAEPELYNVDNYSLPGDKLISFNLEI